MEVRVKKIRLIDFMEALRDIHSNGADYVDILGFSDEMQDTLVVEVRDEYIRDEKLTDELLNSLA